METGQVQWKRGKSRKTKGSCNRKKAVKRLAALLLQHWNKVVGSAGNHILERIDPLDWKLENPWLALDFKVNVFVSKRAFAALQKETKDRPWAEPAEWMSQNNSTKTRF